MRLIDLVIHPYPSMVSRRSHAQMVFFFLFYYKIEYFFSNIFRTFLTSKDIKLHHLFKSYGDFAYVVDLPIGGDASKSVCSCSLFSRLVCKAKCLWICLS